MSHAAGTCDEGTLIRRAFDHEARACRLMMPGIVGPFQAPDLWVAVDRETGLLVGAAGVAWHLVSDPAGFPVYIHVLPSLRRQGIGRALVEMVAKACRDDTARLNSWFDVAADSEGAAFLAATGFEMTRQVFHYEAAGAAFYDRIKVIYDRLAKAGKTAGPVPASFLWRKRRPRAVAVLVADHLPSASVAAVTQMARGAGRHDPERSVVLQDAETVLGVLLYSWNAADPLIDCWVVAPAARGTAANLMLVEAATRNGLVGGANRFRFSCTDDVHDTIKLAQRGGARLTETKLRFSQTI